MNDITSITGERKKQLIKIGLILAAIFTVLFLLVKFTENKKALPKPNKDEIDEKIKNSKFSGTAIETEKDVWIAKSEGKLQALEEGNVLIRQQLNELTESLESQDNANQFSVVTPTQNRPAPPLDNNRFVTRPVDIQPLKIAPGIKRFSFANQIEISRTLGQKSSFISPVSKTKEETSDVKEEEAVLHKTRDNWIPSGSFMSGILLSGLDAPTGGQAQSNPHPVLIKVTDNAILPNRFRTNVKECFITAGGYGDISSERAYIRTETLSCVLKDGNIIDASLKGYIAGEDGKNGIRGRLVSKEGQLLARGMMAGFASGVSDAFKSSASSFSISPLGAVQTVDPEKMLEAGAYSGAGKAMERLANYYISMAEKVFPIIEIDSGRKIDVVLLKGISMELENS